jgi:plasmid maintenance system antidote protein VapI
MAQMIYRRNESGHAPTAAAVAPIFQFVAERGIRLTWLAEQLGISRQTLNAIRCGRAIPDDFVVRAAVALDVPAKTLLEWLTVAA